MTAPTSNGNLPALFVGHGAPTLPYEPGAARDFLAGLGERLPRPKAVLCISAHWCQAEPTVSMAAQPATIHDFYGFPPELYALRYPAPGAPEVAGRAAELREAAGLACRIDEARGLDHGAWVPMSLIYPQADVPVAQISVQPRLGPRHHVLLGQALAPLRAEGVLILASGGATHDLRRVGMYELDAEPPEDVRKFDAWLVDAVTKRCLQHLIEYRSRAPHAVRNHPSEEHFLPLFVALGAALDNGTAPEVEVLHRSYSHGILAMTAFAFANA
jgi:4,5-DOPA dioxygenase extradiol